ncbi:diaminopimelate epimerase [Rivibacter subsaxonicus]|nr:diaminopimelate epimerase [Rivibacter subsaxonicus]
MRLRFTKMQGAGNDFVVLDATRAPLDLSPAQYRFLADRRFGVGADQILIVGPAPTPDVDFGYRIVNADGGEVEHCGNGARCFVRYVQDAGLTTKNVVRVAVAGGVLELRALDDGRVTVDMGAPIIEPAQVPFDASGLRARELNGGALWTIDVADSANERPVELAVVSMGNPHAVMNIAQFDTQDVDAAPVAELGPKVEAHPRFPRRVNAGFMQIVSPAEIRLRVYERGVGETLACGTGACAAVVAGVRLGWLRAGAQIGVHTRGGLLTIEWGGGASDPVLMTGPATRVFEGEIELPATI